MQLHSNTVLITGGASGIGLELARRFLQESSTVIICGRRKAKLDEARGLLPELKTLVCDLSKERQRVRLAEWAVSEFPRLNVLVNNAGIQQRGKNAGPTDLGPTPQEEPVNVQVPQHLPAPPPPPLPEHERPARPQPSARPPLFP